MLRNDYLMRMIDEIVQAVMRAVRLVQEHKREEAQEELNAAYAQLGLARHLLDLLEPDSLVRMLADHQLPAAFELFVGNAQLCLLEDDPGRGRKLAELARAVCTRVETEMADWPGALEARSRLAELEQAMTR